MYLIDLTIGPTFLAAGIYLCMARIVVVYDGGQKQLARLKPRSYTLVFLGWDFLSLLLQAVGGAIASLAADGSSVCIDSPSRCVENDCQSKAGGQSRHKHHGSWSLRPSCFAATVYRSLRGTCLESSYP
jgi:hypothetical protein